MGNTDDLDEGKIKAGLKGVLKQLKNEFGTGEEAVAYRQKRERERNAMDAQWEVKNGPLVFRGSAEGVRLARERMEFYKTQPDDVIAHFEQLMREKFPTDKSDIITGFKVEPYLAALREVRVRHQAGDEIDFLERLLSLQPPPEQKEGRSRK
jgi:hypothetical protein